jgi:hypothetical protein
MPRTVRSPTIRSNRAREAAPQAAGHFDVTPVQWFADLFIAAPLLGQPYVDTSCWSFRNRRLLTRLNFRFRQFGRDKVASHLFEVVTQPRPRRVPNAGRDLRLTIHQAAKVGGVERQQARGA